VRDWRKTGPGSEGRQFFGVQLGEWSHWDPQAQLEPQRQLGPQPQALSGAWLG